MSRQIQRVAFTFLLASCLVSAAWATQPDGKGEPDKLQKQQCGKIERLHALGKLMLASQPEKEDFAMLKTKGVKAVINLREASELDWDEPGFVKKLGMEYHHIPIQSPDTLTDAVFEKLRKLLNDKSKQPLLLHCASANRVGAIWLAHRVLDDGVPYAAALKEAKQVGLKSQGYEDKSKDYIQRMQK